MKLLVPAVLLCTLIAVSAPAQPGEQILQKAVDTQQSESSAMEIRMLLVKPDGEETSRRFQTLVLNDGGLIKTVTVFLEPASVENTRFLTIENESRQDDQWIYLPALRKVKRIASSEQSGSFMGSDFSYSDMSFANAALEEGRHTLLREESLNGLACYVVESIPLEQTASEYGKEITWVDKSTWLTPRVEFYGKDGTVTMKVLTAGNFEQVQGRGVARSMTMPTVESGHKTILEIRQVKYDIPIDPGYFTTTFLESGRTR